MNSKEMAEELKKAGYPPRKADAKIARDIVLKAFERADFHDKMDVKTRLCVD